MADPVHNIPPQVTEALARGRLVEAIKLLRAHTPQLGLAEAKALLDALQKQGVVKVDVKKGVKAAISHSTTPHGPAHHAPPSHSMDPFKSPGEMPRASNAAVFAGVAIALVVVIFAAAWFGGL